MKRLLTIIPLLILACISRAEPANLSAAIDSLDDRLARRKRYVEMQQRYIDSLKQAASASPGLWQSVNLATIADAYRRLNIDSAIRYYDKALEQRTDTASSDYKLIVWKRSSILPVSGLVMEAIASYNATRPEAGDSEAKLEYYLNGVTLYSYVSDFYESPSAKQYYAGVLNELNDSLLRYLPPGDRRYHFYKSYKHFMAKEYTMAVAELNEMLQSLDRSDNHYARVHSILSQYYKMEGREDESLYHLALAAMGDIESATLEANALQRLGMKLYERGDLNRAYRYMMIALDGSVKGGSRIRTLENARSLPMIAETFRKRDEDKLTLLTVIIAVLVLALVVIMIMLLMMRRKQRDYHQMQMKMKDNAELKDAYIGRVLSMCSMFMEGMESFNRLAGRKIKTGQVEDLYHMIESGKILQEQASQFYEVFDHTFFAIYPDFIEQVNKLLQPDKQIVLSSPDRLTPESRILAFMRLGIDDSAKLSKFLGLSVNTIYTYRNKLKSRAVDRESFEQKVREIGKIS